MLLRVPICNNREAMDLDELLLKIQAIRRELRAEYLQPHNQPWIVGFSGGKDSTVLAHFVIECLFSIPPDERRRSVYIVSNDTLVESPVFQSFVDKMLARISDNIGALRVPVEVVKTTPLVEESFWVNMLGKGYPAPNQAVLHLQERFKASERRACHTVNQPRATQRYHRGRRDKDAPLVAALRALSARHPRAGYRMAAAQSAP